MPKRGRALIWPSVLNENPHQKDPRTDHEAMPVIKGEKYGANAWQHIRDFKEPFRRVRLADSQGVIQPTVGLTVVSTHHPNRFVLRFLAVSLLDCTEMQLTSQRQPFHLDISLFVSLLELGLARLGATYYPVFVSL